MASNITLSLAMINIPVAVHTATEEKKPEFHRHCSCGARISQKQFCSSEGKEVPYNQMLKGYEIAKDKSLIFQQNEIEAVKVKSSSVVDIKQFVKPEEIDNIYYDSVHFVAPQKKVPTKPFQFLREVMKQAGVVAIGTYTHHGREHTVAIRPYGRGFILHELHYIDEIKPMDEIKEIDAMKDEEITSQEIMLGMKLIESKTSPIDFTQYKDSYVEELNKLITAKAMNQTYVAPTVSVAQPSNDLLAALQASVGSA